MKLLFLHCKFDLSHIKYAHAAASEKSLAAVISNICLAAAHTHTTTTAKLNSTAAYALRSAINFYLR